MTHVWPVYEVHSSRGVKCLVLINSIRVTRKRKSDIDTFIVFTVVRVSWRQWVVGSKMMKDFVELRLLKGPDSLSDSVRQSDQLLRELSGADQ